MQDILDFVVAYDILLDFTDLSLDDLAEFTEQAVGMVGCSLLDDTSDYVQAYCQRIKLHDVA